MTSFWLHFLVEFSIFEDIITQVRLQRREANGYFILCTYEGCMNMAKWRGVIIQRVHYPLCWKHRNKLGKPVKWYYDTTLRAYSTQGRPGARLWS
jgi:hypothetical protein